MYIVQKSSSPLHFLYGEKLLVWREYFKFDWIFSNIENEIKHSQCENKCWEILFFCLFGIKVLSIKKRNLKRICLLCISSFVVSTGWQRATGRLIWVLFIFNHQMCCVHVVTNHIIMSHTVGPQWTWDNGCSWVSSSAPPLPTFVVSHKQDSLNVTLKCFFFVDQRETKWGLGIKRWSERQKKKNKKYWGKEEVMQTERAAEIKARQKPHSPSLLRRSLYSESLVQQQELF